MNRVLSVIIFASHSSAKMHSALKTDDDDESPITDLRATAKVKSCDHVFPAEMLGMCSNDDHWLRGANISSDIPKRVTGTCSNRDQWGSGLWAQPIDATSVARWYISLWPGQDCQYVCNVFNNYNNGIELKYGTAGFSHTGHQIVQHYLADLGRPPDNEFGHYNNGAEAKHLNEYESFDFMGDKILGANNKLYYVDPTDLLCYEVGVSDSVGHERGCLDQVGNWNDGNDPKEDGTYNIATTDRLACTCRDVEWKSDAEEYAPIHDERNDYILVPGDFDPVGADPAFMCECDQGWSGLHCQYSDNDCEAANLQNECSLTNTLSCVDGHNEFKCVCKEGWIGKTCDQKDMCHVSHKGCLHGVCKATKDNYDKFVFSCICGKGFTGPHCETVDTASCANETCSGKGACKLISAGFGDEEQDPHLEDYLIIVGHTCECDEGYHGTSCELNAQNAASCDQANAAAAAAAKKRKEEHETLTRLQIAGFLIAAASFVQFIFPLGFIGKYIFEPTK